MHDNWKKWKTDVSQETQDILDENGGFSPTARCDSLKGGHDNGYMNAKYCRILSKALIEAAEFLEKNNTSNR